jgi:hypothetical protein
MVHETREEGIDIDPESAAHHRGRARGLGGGILDTGQQRLDMPDGRPNVDAQR